MKHFISLLLAILPLLSTGQQLTGEWSCNDGGTYYLRQLGNQLWWYGENGSQWTNVFHGKIINDGITGDWTDIPKGKDQNHGTLGIIIRSDNRLERVKQTGNFSGSIWTRGTDEVASGDHCFKLYPNSAISGHNKKIIKASLEQCKKECLENDWCKSFDYDPKAQKGYLQDVDVMDVGNLRKDNQYDHYQNLCRTGGSTSVDNCFKLSENSSIPGHNRKIIRVNLQECKDACLDNDWCKSFDYNPETQKCYLQDVDITDVKKLSIDKKYDHYQNLCWPGRN